uniref:SFRICE_018356 n=1 Tax=Spodoptera frugiperda TaxID=7108 RepID=A0A2H1X1F6_SPOFR
MHITKLFVYIPPHSIYHGLTENRLGLPEAQLPPFPIFIIPDSLTTPKFRQLVTPLVFRMSNGGGDCLLSGDSSARLPAYTYHKKTLIKHFIVYI